MGSIGWWMGGIFTPIGLLFAAIGVGLVAKDRRLAEDGMRTSGTVIEIVSSRNSDGGRMYRPVIEFVDGEGELYRFTSRTSTSWASHSRGDRIEILYDVEHPQDAVIDGFAQRHLMPTIFLLLGSITAVVGIGFLWFSIRDLVAISRLKRRGLHLEAEFVECTRDTRIRVNGRSPYRVRARGRNPGTGRMASFTSAPIWLDLTEELRGKTVPVRVDPQTSKKHHVDLGEWVGDNQKA